MSDTSNGRGTGPWRLLALAAFAASLLAAIAVSAVLVSRWHGSQAKEKMEQVGPDVVTRAPTPQEVEGVTAAVRERTMDAIRSIRVCPDGSVLVFVSEGRGRREFRVQQVDGPWQVVAQKEFYAFRATIPA